MRHGPNREIIEIDRRLARERDYETRILRLKIERERLRGFLHLIAKVIPASVILSDEFHRAAAIELGSRISLAAAALRGDELPKEDDVQAETAGFPASPSSSVTNGTREAGA